MGFATASLSTAFDWSGWSSFQSYWAAHIARIRRTLLYYRRDIIRKQKGTLSKAILSRGLQNLN